MSYSQDSETHQGTCVFFALFYNAANSTMQPIIKTIYRTKGNRRIEGKDGLTSK